MDTAGKVVIADETASVLMGVPASTPALDPTVRWNPGLPELIGAARYATRQAARNPDWVGSTQIFTHLSDEPTSISIRPVFLSGHLIGNLVSFGASEGAQLPPAEGVRASRARSRAGVVATRDNRMVLLRLPEVSVRRVGGQRRVAVHRPGTVARRLARAWTSSRASWRMPASCGCTAATWSTSAASGRSSAGEGGELSLVMDDRANRDGAGLPAERAGRAPCAGHLTSQHGRILLCPTARTPSSAR